MSEDMVRCDICRKEMGADIFSSHALTNHENEVLALLSDDDIIGGLSAWVNP